MKEGAKQVEEGGKIITIVTSLLAAFTGFYTSYALPSTVVLLIGADEEDLAGRYAGSKAPVEHFTRGVAKELAGRGVSVNAIGPGPMDTRKLSTPPLKPEPQIH